METRTLLTLDGCCRASSRQFIIEIQLIERCIYIYFVYDAPTLPDARASKINNGAPALAAMGGRRCLLRENERVWLILVAEMAVTNW